MAQPIRNGLITAQMEITETGIAFLGPLAFDEETVCATGRWEASVDVADDKAVADALEDVYHAEFEGWCARRAKERAAAAPRVARVPQARLHTPCPVLWAGR
jgi:hypothetical protein